MRLYSRWGIKSPWLTISMYVGMGLCKDVIIEEAEGMTSSYMAHKTKDFLLLRGARPLTACRRDWS